MIRKKEKSFHFRSSSKTEDQLKFYWLSDATFYDRINTKYQFIKPFLDKKMSANAFNNRNRVIVYIIA